MSSRKSKPEKNATPDRSVVFQSGKRPEVDAWFKAFMIENHLDYYGYPDMVAPPEQARFMIFSGDEDIYYPCSDQMFETIMGQKKSPLLLDAYQTTLEKILALVDEKIEDKKEKEFLKALITIKFRNEYAIGKMFDIRLSDSRRL